MAHGKEEDTPSWGLLFLVLLLFGVSFGFSVNDGHDLLRFSVPGASSAAMASATVLISSSSGRTGFLAPAANKSWFRPSQPFTTHLRHHHVRHPIQSPVPVAVGYDSANKLGSWQTTSGDLLDFHNPRGVQSHHQSAAETTKLSGVPSNKNTKARRSNQLGSSSFTDL